MANAAITAFYKNVTTAGTPVVLGLVGTKFREIRIFAQKAEGVPNVGAYMLIRPAGSPGWEKVYSEAFTKYGGEGSTILNAAMFEIDSDTNGDGVYCVTQAVTGYDGPA